MFKGLVLAKFFLAPFANVYNIVRKMKRKEYKENQSRFSFNKKKKKGNITQNENLKLSF